MRINSPSLYAAFGSKADLFREALEHYGETQGSRVNRALQEGRNARESIEAMLRASAEVITAPGQPRGCPIVLSAINYSPGNERMRDYGRRLRETQREAIRARLARAKDDGELPDKADLDRMTAFYSAALYGLAVHARDGATRETLQAIVDGAMAAWDGLARGSGAA